MKKIGIFGGTFSPVHNEHVSLARAGINELGLDALYVLPTNVSPHKKSTGASKADRLNMLKLAFSLDEKVVVSDYEITRGEVSYSYITAEHFKSQYNAEIFMLVGADMLKDFKEEFDLTEYNWEDDKHPEIPFSESLIYCTHLRF